MLNYLWAAMMAAGIFWAAAHGNPAAVTNGALDSAKEAVALCITMLGVMPFWCGILKIAEKAGLTEALTRRMRPVIRFLFPDLPDGHPAAAHIAANMIANILGLGWAATPEGLEAMRELGKLDEERRRDAGGPSDSELVDPGPTDSGPTDPGSMDPGPTDSGPADPRPAGPGPADSGPARMRRGRKMCAVPRGTAGNEMCTFLIINISSLQLIPINMIAYRSQYGSADPASVVGPAIAATAASTLAAVIFCRIMNGRRHANRRIHV